MPAPLLHAMTCGRVRRWMTCVLHTVSDSGSGHAHTEGFCAFRLVGTRRSFRTSGVHHLEEVRATNWGNRVYVGAQANGARTIKERSVGHSWRRTSASSITRQTDLWRSWVEFGQSLKAERTAAFRSRTLQTCHSASGQLWSNAVGRVCAQDGRSMPRCRRSNADVRPLMFWRLG